MNHTPTPWVWDDPPQEKEPDTLGRVLGADGKEVMNFGKCTEYYPTQGDEPAADDRKFMLFAANAHDRLVGALETLLKAASGSTAEFTYAFRHAEELLQKLKDEGA